MRRTDVTLEYAGQGGQGLTWQCTVLELRVLEPRSREVGSFAQRHEFLPCHCRIELTVAGKCAKAAIGTGHHAFDADYSRKALNSLRNELRVLNIV